MIKPEALWAMFKDVEDSKWIGEVCRALGGQKVELDYGQRQMYNVIKRSSGWEDERIDAARAAARERKRLSRATAAPAAPAMPETVPPPAVPSVGEDKIVVEPPPSGIAIAKARKATAQSAAQSELYDVDGHVSRKCVEMHVKRMRSNGVALDDDFENDLWDFLVTVNFKKRSGDSEEMITARNVGSTIQTFMTRRKRVLRKEKREEEREANERGVISSTETCKHVGVNEDVW